LKIIGEDEFVESGDLGHALDQGYWWISGRTNEVFKRYGEKIALQRLLETVYSAWSSEAAFYKETDPAGEEGHVLVISPTPSGEQVRSILQAFRKNHPRTHWPLRIESTDVLPLLENGKIDLAGLNELKERILHWRQRI